MSFLPILSKTLLVKGWKDKTLGLAQPTTNNYCLKNYPRPSQINSNLLMQNKSSDLNSQKPRILNQQFSIETLWNNNAKYYQQVLDQKPKEEISQNKMNSFQKLQQSSCIAQGVYQANSPCQDRLVVGMINSLNAQIISIFDGHGGYELAQYASIKLHSVIEAKIKAKLKNRKVQEVDEEELQKIINQVLVSSYQEIQQSYFDIYQQQIKLGNKKIYRVGSCGITALIFKNKIYIANVGDSQVIFVTNKQKNYGYLKGNSRLSTNNSKERERLKKQFPEDEDILLSQRKNVYYLKGKLQPTRTLGDYYLKKEEFFSGEGKFNGPYLTCKPEITKINITGEMKYLIVASDGLWDFLNKYEITRILTDKGLENEETEEETKSSKNEKLPNENKAEVLINRVLQKVSKNMQIKKNELKLIKPGERRNYHDDISIAVATLAQ